MLWSIYTSDKHPVFLTVFSHDLQLNSFKSRLCGTYLQRTFLIQCRYLLKKKGGTKVAYCVFPLLFFLVLSFLVLNGLRTPLINSNNYRLVVIADNPDYTEFIELDAIFPAYYRNRVGVRT